MSCLPNDHVPLRGSEGERMRARLYLNQLPPHDTNPASCHKLSDLEKKRLVKFAERRKNKSSSVGNVVMLEQEGHKVTTVAPKTDVSIAHLKYIAHLTYSLSQLYKCCI